MAAIKGPRLYKKQIGTHREKKHVLTLTLMLARRKSACKTSAGSSKIFRWLAPLLGPKLDPKTGPKQRPKRRNENVIQFWTRQPLENFVATRECFASRFATQQLEHECQHIPFSLCASQGRLLLYKKQIGTHREKACVNTYAHASAPQICLQNICGQQQNFPMAGPLLGPNLDPKRAQAKT